MEKIFNIFVDRVRLDAIAKLRLAGGDAQTQQQLFGAVQQIMTLADRARKEGVLVLEDMAKELEPEYLRQLIVLVVDGTCPELIVEIATNLYWTKAPDKAEAMIDYLYLRGMLAIQDGVHPRLLEEILLSLMPCAQREEYRAQIKALHEQGGMEKLFSIHPSFQDAGIWDAIHQLEKKVSVMDNRCVQRLLRELDNRDLAVCIYVFQQDVRKKLLGNLSAGLANAIVEDVALCASSSEREVATSVHKVQGIISLLQDVGEIIVPESV
ncbi:MAG: hypothetical protein K2P39_02735 [Lachnospiraceae bacterium]|nr:hypothetical protein [Lachnospiraceae bacterium]